MDYAIPLWGRNADNGQVTSGTQAFFGNVLAGEGHSFAQIIQNAGTIYANPGGVPTPPTMEFVESAFHHLREGHLAAPEGSGITIGVTGTNPGPTLYGNARFVNQISDVRMWGGWYESVADAGDHSTAAGRITRDTQVPEGDTVLTVFGRWYYVQRVNFNFAAQGFSPPASAMIFPRYLLAEETVAGSMFGERSVVNFAPIMDENGRILLGDDIRMADGTVPIFDPMTVNRPGYTFAGWRTEANGGGTLVTSETLLTDINQTSVLIPTLLPVTHWPAITLHAYWVEEVIHTVTFDLNGGEGAFPPLSVPHGQRVDMPESEPYRAGYTFLGWYTAPVGGLAFDFGQNEIVADTTVYAKWQLMGPEVTILQTVNPDSVTAGGTNQSRTVTYTLQIENTGNVRLTDLVVTSDVDVSLTNVQVLGYPVGVTNASVGQNLVFYIDSLDPEDYLELGFTAVVGANVVGGTQISNRAYVRSVTHDLEVYALANVSVTQPQAPPTQPPGGGPIGPPIIPDPWRQAYLIGTEHGMILPRGYISRGEVATIFFRLLADETRGQYWMQTNPFEDVALEQWFNNAISTTTNMGLFMGIGDNLFAPKQQMTRGELAAVVVRFMERDTIGQFVREEDQFTDTSTHWARDYINRAAIAGWIQGPYGIGGVFNPHDPVTRAETAAMINRIFGRLVEDSTWLIEGMNVWPDNQNEAAWYYLYMQMATNSYTYRMRTDNNSYKRLISVTQPRDWSVLERPYSQPDDIFNRQ